MSMSRDVWFLDPFSLRPPEQGNTVCGCWFLNAETEALPIMENSSNSVRGPGLVLRNLAVRTTRTGMHPLLV